MAGGALGIGRRSTGEQIDRLARRVRDNVRVSRPVCLSRLKLGRGQLEPLGKLPET